MIPPFIITQKLIKQIRIYLRFNSLLQDHQIYQNLHTDDQLQTHNTNLNIPQASSFQSLKPKSIPEYCLLKSNYISS